MGVLVPRYLVCVWQGRKPSLRQTMLSGINEIAVLQADFIYLHWISFNANVKLTTHEAKA
jgi:hypothetical protein